MKKIIAITGSSGVLGKYFIKNIITINMTYLREILKIIMK